MLTMDIPACARVDDLGARMEMSAPVVCLHKVYTTTGGGVRSIVSPGTSTRGSVVRLHFTVHAAQSRTPPARPMPRRRDSRRHPLSAENRGTWWPPLQPRDDTREQHPISPLERERRTCGGRSR